MLLTEPALQIAKRARLTKRKVMSKTKQLLVAVIILNIALIGAYGFLFYLIKAKSEDASVLSQSLDIQRANQEQVIMLRHAINESKDDRATLDTYFVKSSNLDVFIKSLESLGEESNTAIRLNAFTEINKNSLIIDFNANGTYDDIYYLVTLIEHLPYHIEFKKAYLNSLGLIPTSSPDSKTSVIQKAKKDNTWEANFNIELMGYIKE
jgi:uncharacterized membrane protein